MARPRVGEDGTETSRDQAYRVKTPVGPGDALERTAKIRSSPKSFKTHSLVTLTFTVFDQSMLNLTI